MTNTRVHRKRRLRAAVLGVVLLGLAVPTTTQAGPVVVDDVLDPQITYPNLKPDVQFVLSDISLVFDPETGTVTQGPRTLYFDTWARNEGTVPMQLTLDQVESAESSTVSQCVSWTERVCRGSRVVGGFTWHDEHTHFHFEEFADYELRRLNADGRPDYSASGLIAVSEKVSFCLVDYTTIRDDAPPQFYFTCTPTVQGISPGWADVYESGMPGQKLPIAGLADGRYALVVRMDAGNRLFETNDNDNVVEITVELSNNVTQAAIVGRNYPPPAPECPKKKCKQPRTRPSRP